MSLRRFPALTVLALVCFALAPLSAASPGGAVPTGDSPQAPAPAPAFDRYHRPEEIAAALQDLARANPSFAKAYVLAKSPGGRDLVLLEVGPETAKAAKALPAVFVAADMDGTVPIAAEAGLWLAKSVCAKADLRADRTWYILACGNPDAAARYFAKPQLRDARNGRPMNDDQDDATDEDGPDDLDGDGLITQMRVKDPEGTWTAVTGEPRLMKQADGVKGEKGLWKVYAEGLDNDHDGQYNEDGPGGVNLGTAFPHLFKYHAPDGGPWPGSEPETYALLKFFDVHREIGLAFVLGESNFCLNPPRAGRKGGADLNQIKVPERLAGFINADPARTYTMAEIIELVKPLVPPGMEVTEGLVAGFLELGAAVNPLEDDLKFYKELSEKYKEFLKAAKLDGKRLEPAADKDGSLELYAYYQLGLPSFALDFWTLPEVKEEKPADEMTPEKLEKMTNDEFVALGEEKINAFLKASGAPDEFKAKQVIEAVKGGQMDTRKMAEMMKQMPRKPEEGGADPKEKALLAWSDKELGGQGFLPWKPFKHPTLGDVEIGGAAPFADNTPPARMIEGLVQGQAPWVFEVSRKMARIRIAEAKVTKLGAGVYEVKAWIENAGDLPYPTAIGARNQRILPVVVTLGGDGFEIAQGRKRSLVPAVPARGAQAVTWIVRAAKPVKIEIKAETRIAWSDARTIDLGGAK
ncbi:MAG: M14 family zinc carboxypeptidase [Acidobacteriota bacterium]